MDGIIGEIRLWSAQWTPYNWMPCVGQTLAIQQYAALYSVLGTQFGGDGRVNFALPDLRGRVAVGPGRGSGLTERIAGQTFGESQVTLQTSQLPAHTHALEASGGDADLDDPTGAYPAKSAAVLPYGNSADGTMATAALLDTGGGQPHNNLQPYLSVGFIICVNGLYPSRS